MKNEQVAFQIEQQDNVATALTKLMPGEVILRGDGDINSIVAIEEIPTGHKIALRHITPDEKIIKYGIPIGVATKAINMGSWVHLHCIQSIYDAASARLDAITNIPVDTDYS